MARPKNTTREPNLISADEAESLKNDLNTLKEMAGAGEMSDKGYTPTAQIDDISVDKESIRRKIAVLNHQLDSHRNQKVTDSKKRDELFKRRAYLESKFSEYLETWQDLGVIRRDSPDWMPAFRKASRRPEVEHLISEWRRIGLMLEPDDSSFNSLDRLRK